MKSEPVNSITKIYKVTFGRKFYIPAEFDIFVSFAPIANSPSSTFTESPSGKLRFRSKVVLTVTSIHLDDPNVVIQARPTAAQLAADDATYK